MRRVVRVGGLAGGEASKFGCHGLAEHDRAGGARQCDTGGVGGRAVALVNRRAVAGRHVGGVDQILDRERYAVQRAARRLGIALPRRSERRLGIEIMPGADEAFACGDPIEAGARQCLGAETAGGNLLRGGANRKGERVRHGVGLGRVAGELLRAPVT